MDDQQINFKYGVSKEEITNIIMWSCEFDYQSVVVANFAINVFSHFAKVIIDDFFDNCNLSSKEYKIY